MKLKLFQLSRVVRPEGFSGGVSRGWKEPHGGLGGPPFWGELQPGRFSGATGAFFVWSAFFFWVAPNTGECIYMYVYIYIYACTLYIVYVDSPRFC